VEDFDAQKWVTVVENCIASGYDAICFMGLSEAMIPVTNKGVDAGILMFVFNGDSGEGSKRQAFFGQEHLDGGAQCGRALEEVMGGEGKYGIITGDFSVLSHEQRRTGARSVMDANANLKLVGEWMNNDKMEEAYSLTTDMLTANPDLGGVYVTAGGPSGAAKAVEDAGKAGEVKVVCHDVLMESAPYIASGTIQACLDQDPFNQGYHPVIAAFNQLVAGIVPAEYNWYDGVMATPATVKDLFPELFK
jgi:ABC-type sugar transport system substrate-binding protein